MPTELTTTERKQFEQDKATVRKGMATFVDVGKALMRIRDKKSYRETHKTFEEFCKAEFDIGKTYAHYLIGSAEAVQNVHNCEQKPANESQARKLSSVPKEEQPAVWEEVVNSAPIDSKGEKKITAKHVESVVEAKVSPKKPTETNLELKELNDLLTLLKKAARIAADINADLYPSSHYQNVHDALDTACIAATEWKKGAKR